MQSCFPCCFYILFARFSYGRFITITSGRSFHRRIQLQRKDDERKRIFEGGREGGGEIRRWGRMQGEGGQRRDVQTEEEEGKERSARAEGGYFRAIRTSFKIHGYKLEGEPVSGVGQGHARAYLELELE